MRARQNLFTAIQPRAFSVIHGSPEDFARDLADIPEQYPAGRITDLTSYPRNPYLRIREGYQDRVHFQAVFTLDDLMEAIITDRSTLLILEYSFHWLITADDEEIDRFAGVCRDRARWWGPVILITCVMDREMVRVREQADQYLSMISLLYHGKEVYSRDQRGLGDFPGREGPVLPTGKCGQQQLLV